MSKRVSRRILGSEAKKAMSNAQKDPQGSKIKLGGIFGTEARMMK
jgi:hypothetical protein